MYKERIELYKAFEQSRGSKVIVYVTGDRPGLETQIHPEVLDLLVSHLDIIGTVPKISLYLYTRGGHTLAAWSIANLIRQYCDEFEVIIPSKAHSAGTLISLGANTIVMTKQATLGPIDPSVNTPLNPAVPGASPNVRVPVSVEAINGFFELAKKTGISSSSDLSTVLSTLAAQVHPLVLGEVYRTRSQIRMFGKRLLEQHMNENKKIEKILSFLCSESGSHDYTIYRQEAKNELGLNVETPSNELYEIIKRIYDDIANELQLTTPYNPEILLSGQNQVIYYLERALVESTDGGSHKYVNEGQLQKQTVAVPNGIPQEVIQDNRKYEGWKHEKLQIKFRH
jgi:ClpP class serine protease